VRVDGLVREGERVAGVQAGGETLAAGTVVVAAGAWTSLLDGLDPAVTAALRPVKGQVLRLRGPRLLERVVHVPDAYLVPRDDGELVVGATQEEQGFDQRVTAGGVFDLLRAAYDGVPGITELTLEETHASLRPGSRDNAPLMGPLGDGLVLACGHHRNGILLAPASAELVAEAVAGTVSERLAPFAPDRFSRAHHAQR
jgi:glycine oxidase